MEKNDELKETDTKNCTYFHFTDIIKIDNFDFDNVLLDEKAYEDILIYDKIKNHCALGLIK